MHIPSGKENIHELVLLILSLYLKQFLVHKKRKMKKTYMRPTKKKLIITVITEMQLKTTLRYHLMLVRMVIIKKSGNDRSWRECGEIGTLLHCWWECKIVQPLWKMAWQSLKGLKPETPFDTAISLLNIYPKDYKSFFYKDTCAHVFIVALFTTAKICN